MKRVQKQNQKFIHWGLLTFLMGAGLLLNANPSETEAIEFSNSHLGTFEGGTVFTISSSTGIQPTLAVELKNQDGSTKQYETQNGSLTISNTKEGATIKSAILTGQTLENLISDITQIKATSDVELLEYSYSPMSFVAKYGNITGNTSINRVVIHAPFRDRLKLNENYTIVYDYELLENPDGVDCQIGVAVDNWGQMAFSPTIQTPGSNGKVVYLRNRAENDISKSFNFINNSGANSKWRISNLMLLEGDWTNGGLPPYFEGMQSVQMSALTITNGEPEQIEDTNGSLIPNPSFKSTTIRFEEEVILRSNGEVYDELDLMTGKLTQRLDENNEVLANPIVRVVKMKAEPIFNAVTQAEVSIVGEVKPTMVSVTVPTAPLSFVLDPNKEPDQQFIASEFSLTNDGQAPVTIELKEFVQTTTIFKDVMPDYYDSWDYLTKEESKSIALGLVPQESENWLSFNPGIYYAADRQNKVIGRVKQKSTVDFEFIALHGPSFESMPNPQYRLTFVFGF